MSKAKAYVDGSYNPHKRIYGYGVVLITESGEAFISKGSGKNRDYVTMRNVAGELMGAGYAIKECLKRGIKELDLYYDYTGIENWAIGYWKTNKKGTIEYKEFYDSIRDKIKINFIKVKAHSGNKYNDIADILAKESVGL